MRFFFFGQDDLQEQDQEESVEFLPKGVGPQDIFVCCLLLFVVVYRIRSSCGPGGQDHHTLHDKIRESQSPGNESASDQVSSGARNGGNWWTVGWG